EAEGTEDSVRAQFQTFQELVKIAPAGIQSPEPLQPPTPPETVSQTEETSLPEIFNIDSSKQTVTLRVSPDKTGTKKEAVGIATLLLLYGFRKCLAQDDLLGSRLADALRDSGVGPVDRIDRAADPLVANGMITRTGQRRGTKYRITNKGMTEAEKLSRE